MQRGKSGKRGNFVVVQVLSMFARFSIPVCTVRVSWSFEGFELCNRRNCPKPVEHKVLAVLDTLDVLRLKATSIGIDAIYAACLDT